ncbi:hypothetical protein DFH09DRAFT_1416339, partial [Mycena vulgaris]
MRRGPALACGCADVVPALFDVLYPMRGRPMWALCLPFELRTASSTYYTLSCGARRCRRSRILILLREGGGVALWLSRKKRRHAFPLTGVFVSPPHPCALDTPPVVVRRSLDGRRTNESVYIRRRATWLAFHCYCFYLPANYISTSSIPPCTTRVILGCSWSCSSSSQCGCALRRLFFRLFFYHRYFFWVPLHNVYFYILIYSFPF